MDEVEDFGQEQACHQRWAEHKEEYHNKQW